MHTYFLCRYIYILHIHTYFMLRYRSFALHIHTFCYARDIFSCTYTRRKKTSCFEEALPCKTQSNVTMGLQNPRDFQGAILTWNDYCAVVPGTFDSKTWTTANAFVTPSGCSCLLVSFGLYRNHPRVLQKLYSSFCSSKTPAKQKLCKTQEIWSCPPKNMRELLPARRELT